MEKKKSKNIGLWIIIFALVALVIVLTFALTCVSFALVMGPEIDKLYKETYQKKIEETNQYRAPRHYPKDEDAGRLNDEENLNDEYEY